LKLDVPPGSAEQGIFFETICPDGAVSEARIAELRAGITLVLDRLAWTWIKEAGSHLT
jgi:hypothetical protein